MGAIFATLFFPATQRIKRAKPFGALLLTLGIGLLLVLPISIFVLIALKSAFFQLHDFKLTFEGRADLLNNLMHLSGLQKVIIWITERFPVSSAAITDIIYDLLSRIGSKGGQKFGEWLKAVPSNILSLLIGLISFYSFLKDGQRIVVFVEKYSFFAPNQTRELLKTLTMICRSVVLAALISGLVQTLIELLVCLFLDIPNLLLIGLAIFVGSFIPVVGAFPMVLGLAIYTMMSYPMYVSIVLLLSGCVLTGIDSLIRPWFLQGSANLNPFIAFVTALGGVQAFGFFGIFIGPIIAAVVMQIIHLYTDQKTKCSVE
jgi:predicted PurR-regulated permease PerM